MIFLPPGLYASARVCSARVGWSNGTNCKALYSTTFNTILVTFQLTLREERSAGPGWCLSHRINHHLVNGCYTYTPPSPTQSCSCLPLVSFILNGDWALPLKNREPQEVSEKLLFVPPARLSPASLLQTRGAE